MLLVNNISFQRNNKDILRNINISLPSKKIIYLEGNNGVGKTTLLKIICNILEPNEGAIFWNGKNIKKNLYNYYSNFTFIMDNNTSITNLTLYENIIYWKKLFSSKIKESEIEEVLKFLALNKYKNTITGHLSYGEKKKLELLRLIIEQKKMWVLDEPYIGLDKPSIEIINQTIVNHVELEGMVIFTSHILPNLSNIETIHI